MSFSIENNLAVALRSPMLLPHAAWDNQWFVRSSVNYGLYIHNNEGYTIGMSSPTQDSRLEYFKTLDDAMTAWYVHRDRLIAQQLPWNPYGNLEDPYRFKIDYIANHSLGNPYRIAGNNGAFLHSDSTIRPNSAGHTGRYETLDHALDVYERYLRSLSTMSETNKVSDILEHPISFTNLFHQTRWYLRTKRYPLSSGLYKYLTKDMNFMFGQSNALLFETKDEAMQAYYSFIENIEPYTNRDTFEIKLPSEVHFTSYPIMKLDQKLYGCGDKFMIFSSDQLVCLCAELLQLVPHNKAKFFPTKQRALFAKLYYERIHKDELSKL